MVKARTVQKRCTFRKEADQTEEVEVQTEGRVRTDHSQEGIRKLVGFVVKMVTTRSSVLFGKNETRSQTAQRRVRHQTSWNRSSMLQA